MYNPITTEDFDKWITAESRTFEVKCEVIDGADTVVMSGTGQSGDIISMEWNNVICSNDGLQIGTTCMDEFKMTYRNKDGLPSLMNKEIHPYVGLVCPHENTGGVTVWIPLGIFYVTNTETADEDKTFTLTAYDGMQMFMGDFDATAIGVTFPIKAWTLLTAITSHFGITIEYDANVFALLSSDDYTITVSNGDTLVVQEEINANRSVSVGEPLEGTYRDYIGWIAGLVGANAHMSRDGNLRIARYTDCGLQIPRLIQHMGGTKINFGGSVSYTNIISGTDEFPVYPTSYSGNAITYTNPFITTTELDRVCDELIGEDGITVTPCDIAWRSDPRVDAGDIVYAEDKDGNYFPVYVMERVVRITGGLAEDLHCYGETETAHTLNKSPLVTSFNQKINEAIKTASDYINNTKGTFEWIDNGDGTNGGFTIYENGNNSWLRCTAGGLGISADGGLTYANAITKNGVTASQLDVKDSGATILRAYRTLYNEPRFEIKDTDGDDLYVIRGWRAPQGAREEGVAIDLFSQTSGDTIYKFNTTTNGDTGYMDGSYMTIDPPNRDTDDGLNYGLQMSTTDVGLCSFRIFNERTPALDHIRLAVYTDSNNETQAYIGIRDATYGYKTLTIKQITISGTTYYVLASN